MFTERLAGETQQLGLAGIEVSTETTEDDLAGQVARALGF